MEALAKKCEELEEIKAESEQIIIGYRVSQPGALSSATHWMRKALRHVLPWGGGGCLV